MLISHTMELADLTATATAESLQRSKEHRYQQRPRLMTPQVSRLMCEGC